MSPRVLYAAVLACGIISGLLLGHIRSDAEAAALRADLARAKVVCSP